MVQAAAKYAQYGFTDIQKKPTEITIKKKPDEREGYKTMYKTDK